MEVMDSVKDIVSRAWNAGMTYTEYLELTDNLLSQGKTTGANQSEEMVEYTSLNQVRMKRINKTVALREESIEIINGLSRKIDVLAISEPWCGDAAQIVPVINRLVESSDFMNLRIVLRDENPELMDQFLTNGGKGIPIFVLIDAESGDVLGHWGPRPAEMQQRVMDRKNDPNATPYSEFVKEVQLWYARDKTASTQREFLAKVNEVV